MSSPILHIKDSYFFEVPKSLWRSYRSSRDDFPSVWVTLDEDYLQWESSQFAEAATRAEVSLPAEANSDAYVSWLHADHANAGKPFSAYVETLPWFTERQQSLVDAIKTTKSKKAEDSAVAQAKTEVGELNGWFENWNGLQTQVRDVAAYKLQASDWSQEKIDGYNEALHGKILIPQPFGTLRNLHEPMNGFCVSKYMIVQLVVALIMAFIFIRLANKMRKSDRPKGRLWNLFESVLLFLRDEVARPAIGEHEGDKYVPLLWTVFLFVLGMNLMGMVPWIGAPTSAFGATLGMAGVTLLTGIVMGSKKFGLVGFWLNQVPSMDLHWSLAIFLKPMIWLIEVLGLIIKHLVLGVRLLANMVAGHIVLLGIMTIAFSVEGAMSDSWWIAAPISVLGSTLFSMLELFVAFLQAYIFTFLSALFIGAAVHRH